MGFEWLCPCGSKNSYKGGLTTEAVTTCPACKTKMRIFKCKIVVKTTNKPPKTTKKPHFLNHVGSLEELVIMSIFAINSIKNKKEVKDKNVDSTYYQHYLSWIKWRKTFQKTLGGETNEKEGE